MVNNVGVLILRVNMVQLWIQNSDEINFNKYLHINLILSSFVSFCTDFSSGPLGVVTRTSQSTGLKIGVRSKSHRGGDL